MACSDTSCPHARACSYPAQSCRVRAAPCLIKRDGRKLGFIGPAVSLISLARMLPNTLRGPGEPPTNCEDVRNDAGNTYAQPWRGSFPSPAELSSWYDEAALQIDRAERSPTLTAIPQGTARAAELRAYFDALPNRVVAYQDPRGGALKVARLAQAAFCLYLEGAALAREKAKAPEDRQPRPPEEPGWWDRLKDWFKLPSGPGGSWSLPSFPDLPKLPDWSFPTIEPWMLIAGAAALYLLTRQSPQARAVRRLRGRR